MVQLRPLVAEHGGKFLYILFHTYHSERVSDLDVAVRSGYEIDVSPVDTGHRDSETVADVE